MRLARLLVVAICFLGNAHARGQTAQCKEALRLTQRYFVTAVALSPDGSLLLTGSLDGSVTLWDGTTGEKKQTFSTGRAGIKSVQVSADGRRALAFQGVEASVWDLEDGKEIWRLKGHPFGKAVLALTNATLSADGRRAFSAGQDQTAALWDVDTGKKLQTFKVRQQRVYSMTLTRDGRLAVTGVLEAGFWDLDTGKQVRSFSVVKNNVALALAASRDGKRIVTAENLQSDAVVWNGETGQKLHTLQGHTAQIRSVAMSEDGKRILTGGDDKTAILWDGETGKRLCTLTGHRREVTSVAMSRDGRRLLTGSSDRTAILWVAD